MERLDEAIAYARKLKSEGKVYTVEEWEKRDVQKGIAKTASRLARNDSALPKMSQRNADELKIRGEYVGYSNFFVRNMLKDVTSAGYHKNWFA